MFPGGEERFHKHQPHLRENGKPQMNLNNIGILAAKCAQSDLGTEQGSPTDAFLGVWVVLSRDAAQSVSSETAFCLFTASSDILEVNTPAVARHSEQMGRRAFACCSDVGASPLFTKGIRLINSLKASRCGGGERTLCKIQAEYSKNSSSWSDRPSNVTQKAYFVRIFFREKKGRKMFFFFKRPWFAM